MANFAQLKDEDYTVELLSTVSAEIELVAHSTPEYMNLLYQSTSADTALAFTK